MYNLNWISKYRSELFGVSMLAIMLFYFSENYWQAVKSGVIAVGALGVKGRLILGYHDYIGSIGVEVFLFLSGMGLYYAYSKNPDLPRFYKRRMTRILVPYLIVGIPFWIIKDLVIGGGKFRYMLEDLGFVTFFTQGVVVMWFIGLLIALYLTFPISYALVGKERRGSFPTLLFLIALIVAVDVWIQINMPKLSENITIALARVPVFLVGTYMGKYIKRKISFKASAAAVISAILIVYGLIARVNFAWNPALFRFSSDLYSLGILLVVVWILHGIRNLERLNKVFRFVGNYSLELYLLHVTLRNLMKSLGFPMYRISVFWSMILIAFLLALGLKPLSKNCNAVGVIKLGKGVLNLIYAVQKLQTVRRQILLVSRQSDEPSLDFQMLADRIREEDPKTQVAMMCRKLPRGIVGKAGYLFYMIGPLMKEIARSQVLVLDGYSIPASLLHHRSGLTVVQMWHAMGAFKKFGYAVLGEEEGYSEDIATAMEMHKGYDYVFVSSEECREELEPAYRCGLNKMIVMPLPRVDFLRDHKYVEETRRRIYNHYPKLMNNLKKTILYAPTFRKDAKPSENAKIIERMIEAASHYEYNLIVKPHPLMNEAVQPGTAILDTAFSSMEMLAIADIVITDYSAFILEATCAGKPVFRFVPDRERYMDRRGFFIDLNEVAPGFLSEDPDEVMKAIEREDYRMNEVEAFTTRFIEPREDCTGAITRFLLGQIKENKQNEDIKLA